VSATVLSAAEVLSRVVPILRRSDAFFKVPARPELLAALNAGLADFSQVGKFVTVYPRSTVEATRLARDLHLATRGLAGPRVPFDAEYRPGSLVHYRYGAFRRRARSRTGLIRDPDGKWRADRRGPGLAIPEWIEDPFNRTARKARSPKGPIGTELFVYKALMQRGKGGVYEALDLSVSPPRPVILKEGRRHGETDALRTDGYVRLENEARALRTLARAGLPVSKILRAFRQNGNRYLALERIAGHPLLPFGRTQPKRFSWRRAEEILNRLEPIVAAIHVAGWIWRDCKPSHIFFKRGQLHLLDFEDACPIDRQQRPAWRSKNYSRPRDGKRDANPGEDHYALGVIALQFGTGKFPPASRRGRAAIYAWTRCPEALRGRIEQLLRGKISPRVSR
jgi:serine/threonine protein kinase